ncbi:hypothetical protein [uncultured Aliiroseovarius sp.]|uniref:hypothetical protein n=1 Tax=uncultured Aliiroseovarius sp. TaxID=1658783 RepID=UPI0025941651|nr:hypothetical protein [uncultured Aliiroseovarius sp.]
MTQADTVRLLVTRIARIKAGESWGNDLNPAQQAARDYIGHANQFSRAPSHAAPLPPHDTLQICHEQEPT